jgi:hypothetical protein
MSYDLLVFEASTAPRERAAFLEWYERQVAWSEPHGYNDPAETSEALRRWYDIMTADWPNMNPPEPDEVDVDDPRLTDYSIGREVIYAAFPWPRAEEAYDRVRRAAVEAGVGFYDVSGDEGDGEIHFPGVPLLPPSEGGWRQISAEFRRLSDETGQS